MLRYEQMKLTETSSLAMYEKKRRRKKSMVPTAVLVICLVFSSFFGFVGGLTATRLSSPNYYNNVIETEISNQLMSLTTASGNSPSTVAETASIIRQSVVEISTETVATNFRMRQYITGGAGSGVIISSDGYIVTNHHVINNARSITVTLTNGRRYPAVLVGSDSRTDLAVVKIEADDLAPAVFGDSSTLVVGELAIAVGNPLGELGGSVTSGIISALDRAIFIDGETMSLLQTDAAVNPGNSGGGLFNIEGKLIGIVNAKSTGANIEGIGFAIPINSARPIVNDLIEHGYVRGRIDTGLSLVEISSVQMALWHRVNSLGLYITMSSNPELQNADRIISVNGNSIASEACFTAALSSYNIGDTVTITVERGGTEISVQIVLQEQRS